MEGLGTLCSTGGSEVSRVRGEGDERSGVPS